ncbi:hypothetical protein [Cohnella sp. WQ 127256]|uniref:hypothetical protein n=1 Tax=Cohnella sp. WQ 127256 TaxID=2938790 RepID=UPI002118C7AA|nr:hypothetical protein [Cohnella sp. WQ 127256]
MEFSKDDGELPSHDRKGDTNGTSGSVSIYFIAATAAFLLLTALLIDFARVAAFRKQAELAVKSGVRSTLSSFDPTIYARYGLFIRGGESASELFHETLEGNAASQGDGIFPFLDTQWEETDITESRPLANHDVFRRQVLEEMKYKAPIDLSLEVANRFRGVSGVMKEATATVNILEKMRKAYDRREEAFDDALDEQIKLGENVKQSLESQIGSVGSITGKYEDYVIKRLEDEDRRVLVRKWEERREERERNGEDIDEDQEHKPEGPRYEAEVAAFESSAKSLSTALIKQAASVKSEADSFLLKANEAVLKAKEANDEMRGIVEQSKSTPPVSSGVGTGEEEAASHAENMQTMEQLRKSTEDLVLEQAFFEEYETEINQQYSQSLALASEASSMGSLIGSVPGSTGMGSSLQSGEARFQSAFTKYASEYGSSGSVISARIAKLEAHRSYDNERKQEEKKAKSAWSGAANFLGALTGASGSEKDKAGFEQTNGLYATNKEFNQAEEDQAKAKAERNEDPSEGRDEAMSSSNDLMDVLEGSLLGARDQLYYSEYTITRLSHYDPSLVKEMLRGGDTPLDIHLQEAEYILYGLNNPAGNIAAAYGEVFAFRLAIRTMEGLIECRAMGHPLLVLVAALVYGIRNALLDMNSLVEMGKIQLSKYIKVDTVYTDYLRLFMLLHGGSRSHSARTIAVIEHASGLDFRGAYTYASGEGSASIRLWFFPGLLKVMNRFGNLGGTVKGNRYEATSIADSSYQ